MASVNHFINISFDICLVPIGLVSKGTTFNENNLIIVFSQVQGDFPDDLGKSF